MQATQVECAEIVDTVWLYILRKFLDGRKDTELMSLRPLSVVMIGNHHWVTCGARRNPLCARVIARGRLSGQPGLCLLYFQGVHSGAQ